MITILELWYYLFHFFHDRYYIPTSEALVTTSSNIFAEFDVFN